LGDRAVNAPAGAHLAPMEYEFLLNGAELVHISFISVTSEINKSAVFCQGRGF
jgi:hypothetical protein